MGLRFTAAPQVDRAAQAFGRFAPSFQGRAFREFRLEFAEFFPPRGRLLLGGRKVFLRGFGVAHRRAGVLFRCFKRSAPRLKAGLFLAPGFDRRAEGFEPSLGRLGFRIRLRKRETLRFEPLFRGVSIVLRGEALLFQAFRFSTKHIAPLERRERLHGAIRRVLTTLGRLHRSAFPFLFSLQGEKLRFASFQPQTGFVPSRNGAQTRFFLSDRFDERGVVAKHRLFFGAVFVRKKFQELELLLNVRSRAVGFAPAAVDGASDAGVDFGARDALENFRALLRLGRKKTSEGALSQEHRAREGGKAHSEKFRNLLLPLPHLLGNDFPLEIVRRGKAHKFHRLPVRLHEPHTAAAQPIDAVHLKDDARLAFLFAARDENALFLVFVRGHDGALGAGRHAEEREAHRVENRSLAASRRSHDRKEAAPGVGGRRKVDFVGAPKRIDVFEAQFENLHGRLSRINRYRRSSRRARPRRKAPAGVRSPLRRARLREAPRQKRPRA